MELVREEAGWLLPPPPTRPADHLPVLELTVDGKRVVAVDEVCFCVEVGLDWEGLQGVRRRIEGHFRQGGGI